MGAFVVVVMFVFAVWLAYKLGYDRARDDALEEFKRTGKGILIAAFLVASVGCGSYRAEKANAAGNAHLKAGKPAEAVAAFATAVKLKPNVGKYHYNLGLAYARLAHLDAAAAQFAEAVRLDPGDVEASRFLTLANRAMASRLQPN